MSMTVADNQQNQNHKKSDEDKKDFLTRLIENNPCRKCRNARRPKCNCLPPSGDDDEEITFKKNDSAYQKNSTYSFLYLLFSIFKPKNISLTEQTNNTTDQTTDTTVVHQLPPPTLKNSTLNFKHVAELLLIEINEQTGTLIFRARPNLSPAAQAKLNAFLKLVYTEFAEFKNGLKQQGFSVEGLTANLQNNVLTIKVPSPKYYGLFLQRLSSKALLPTSVVEQHEKITNQQIVNFLFRNTFSPSPRPKAMKKMDQDNLNKLLPQINIPNSLIM